MYIDISNRKIFITVGSWFLQKKKTRAGKKDLLRKSWVVYVVYIFVNSGLFSKLTYEQGMYFSED